MWHTDGRTTVSHYANFITSSTNSGKCLTLFIINTHNIHHLSSANIFNCEQLDSTNLPLPKLKILAWNHAAGCDNLSHAQHTRVVSSDELLSGNDFFLPPVEKMQYQTKLLDSITWFSSCNYAMRKTVYQFTLQEWLRRLIFTDDRSLIWWILIHEKNVPQRAIQVSWVVHDCME